MSGPMYWTSADCAEYLGVTVRYFGDLYRDPDAPVPEPIGRVGNSYLWDPLQFKAGAKKLREWLAAGPDRATAKMQATLKAREEALAQQVAKFEREQKEYSEKLAFFRSCEASNIQQEQSLANHRGPIAPRRAR